MSSAIAACNGNISRASVTTSQDKKAYLEFTVDIRDITHLNEIIHRVENLRGVLSGAGQEYSLLGQMASLRGQDAFLHFAERKQRA